MFIFSRLGAVVSLVRKKMVRYLPAERRATAPLKTPFFDLLNKENNFKAASLFENYVYGTTVFFYY